MKGIAKSKVGGKGVQNTAGNTRQPSERGKCAPSLLPLARGPIGTSPRHEEWWWRPRPARGDAPATRCSAEKIKRQERESAWAEKRGEKG